MTVSGLAVSERAGGDGPPKVARAAWDRALANLAARPCTSLPRTLLDLARTRDERTVDRAIRRAVELRTFDLGPVEAVLLRRWPGTVVLRRAIAAVARDERAEVVTKRELEQRFRELLIRHDLPLPATNVLVPTRGREWEVDALWPDRRLVVELDGWWTHCDRESFRRDHARGVAVRAVGFEVVRLAWDQVVDDEPGTVELLRILLAPRA